jgi:hypothetical protein
VNAALGSTAHGGEGPRDRGAFLQCFNPTNAYARRLTRDYRTPPTVEPVARKLVDDVLGFIGRGRLLAIHPAYGQG